MQAVTEGDRRKELATLLAQIQAHPERDWSAARMRIATLNKLVGNKLAGKSNVTGQLGNSVDRADGAVNGAIDSAKLTAATREQVRAGAQITDAKGNSIGTVQSLDGDNAVVVDGGKLYNIPLSALYSKANSVTGPLVTKLSRAEIAAHAHGSAQASADARSH
ncbi:MAG: hypothetical protein IE934_18225 [Sphingopyxis sp.]|nr:hypothetical protein [Sphingopyxis sp.]